MFQIADNSNPATLFPGTTWEKIEGRFLMGSNSQFSLGSTGGRNSLSLTTGNLPHFRLKVDSFSLGRGTMNITGYANLNSEYHDGTASGSFYKQKVNSYRNSGRDGNNANRLAFDASRNWTGMTTSASPYTNFIGNNEAINIMPLYIVINMWKRLT